MEKEERKYRKPDSARRRDLNRKSED